MQMNDTELDRLLDTWEAPPPPPSIRSGLQARFPQSERPEFSRRLRWVLAIAVASVTLAFGMAQSDWRPLKDPLIRALTHLYEGLAEGIEAWRAPGIVAQIRRSEPKVYVDGQLAPPLKYGPAATIDVQVPGEGVYSFISFRGGASGWTEAGRIHGKIIEFLAGGRQVRVECNSPIVDSDRPVFVRRRP
jgi:hypothetical protein